MDAPNARQNELCKELAIAMMQATVEDLHSRYPAIVAATYDWLTGCDAACWFQWLGVSVQKARQAAEQMVNDDTLARGNDDILRICDMARQNIGRKRIAMQVFGQRSPYVMDAMEEILDWYGGFDCN